MQKSGIIGLRKYYYMFSGIMLVPGLIALLVWGLKLGIDFTGGSMLELRFQQNVQADQIISELTALGFDGSSVQITGSNTALIRTRTLESSADTSTSSATTETETPVVDSTTQAETGSATDAGTELTTLDAPDTADQQISAAGSIDEKRTIIDALTTKFGFAEEVSFQSIGPVIGKELTRKALYSVLVASLGIILYIAWSFRKVPKPASSFRFGVCAIAALLHDVFFLLGVFAILGHFWGVEVNGLFVVATLTVMGFSVHDSIVVFDRIREMLHKEIGQPFEKVVNDSIMETLGRSINTTLTVLLTLLALFLFGGESIRVFSFALLIGTLSGSYSSIFNASPLLVDWQILSDKQSARR